MHYPEGGVVGGTPRDGFHQRLDGLRVTIVRTLKGIYGGGCPESMMMTGHPSSILSRLLMRY